MHSYNLFLKSALLLFYSLQCRKQHTCGLSWSNHGTFFWPCFHEIMVKALSYCQFFLSIRSTSICIFILLPWVSYRCSYHLALISLFASVMASVMLCCCLRCLLVMSFSLSYDYIHDKIVLLQGAVENLLERSAYIQLLHGSVVLLHKSVKTLILSTLSEISASALHCLAFAYKEDLAEFATHNGEEHAAHKYLLHPSYYSSIKSNLIFCGFVDLRVRTSCASWR